MPNKMAPSANEKEEFSDAATKARHIIQLIIVLQIGTAINKGPCKLGQKAVTKRIRTKTKGMRKGRPNELKP